MLINCILFLYAKLLHTYSTTLCGTRQKINHNSLGTVNLRWSGHDSPYPHPDLDTILLSARFLIDTNLTSREAWWRVEGPDLPRGVVVVVDRDVGWGRIGYFEDPSRGYFQAPLRRIQRVEVNVEPRVPLVQLKTFHAIHLAEGG